MMATYTLPMDARPWYRHRWPWLLMLGPALVVVAGIVTIWLAVASDDGLVADDYYKRGLAINQTIGRSERAVALGIVATIDLADDGDLRVRLATPSREPDARPAALRVVFAHPARAGEDVRATLSAGPEGAYRGRVAPLAPGRWTMIVETDAWRLPVARIDGPVAGLIVAASP